MFSICWNGKMICTVVIAEQKRLTGSGHGDLEPHTQWTISHRVHEDAEEVGGQLIQVCDQIDPIHVPLNIDDGLIPIDFVDKQLIASDFTIQSSGGWAPGDLHCCAVDY